MAALIGALRVTLGIDTAAFSEGIKRVEMRLGSVGKSMQSVGASLSQRVTAPLIAAAGAIGIGVGRMAGSLAELGNQAKLANTDVVTFQKLAYAAKSVGIEQEKLTDILKDVNDKVGDFMSTGGGEMQAFFENVAPKIGLTADAFRGLSGADALGLYVASLQKAGLSQSEMTFYMEAIADEATALIPILANNGAEYRRLGEEAGRFGLVSEQNVASAAKFQEAMRGLSQATSALGAALVDSGILDLLAGLITKVTEWVGALNSANPGLTQFGLVAAALAAAVGPVLVALGLAATAIAAIGAPVAIAVAAIIGLTAAVVAFWPEIVAAKDAVVQFGADVMSALNSFGDQAAAKIDEVIASFVGFGAQMAQVGRDIIDGLLIGLQEKWQAVKAWFSSLGESIPAWVREKLGIQSPSTVFAEIGRNIMDGLAGGLTTTMGQVEGQVSGFAQQIATSFADVLTGATDWRSALSGVLSSVGNSLIQSGISGFGAAIGIPGFANGTQFAPGGLALVGERGPELVNLPRGSKVTPNSQIGGGQGAFTYAPTIDARGADQAGIARLEGLMRQQAKDLETSFRDRVLRTISDPRNRGRV